MKNFLEDSLPVWLHFFQIDKLHYFHEALCTKGFIFLTMVAMEIGKRQFLSYHNNGCYEEKKLHQKLEIYRFKLSMQKLGWLDQCGVRSDIAASKLTLKVKIIKVLSFMTNFHNFALRIVTSWARVVKLIFKIGNFINGF